MLRQGQCDTTTEFRVLEMTGITKATLGSLDQRLMQDAKIAGTGARADYFKPKWARGP